MLGPDAGLTPKQPLVDLDQGKMDVVGIDKLDGVMQVGVDGDAKGKRQPIPDKSKIRIRFFKAVSNKKKQIDRVV